MPVSLKMVIFTSFVLKKLPDSSISIVAMDNTAESDQGHEQGTETISICCVESGF